jgi:Ca2+-binding RTX toxin-like protein
VKRAIVMPIGVLLAMLLSGGVALAATEPAPGKCSPEVPTWCKGTDGDNTLIGTPNGDRLEGLAGNDGLWGLGGTDALYGGAGKDEIHGDNSPSGYTGLVGTANWDALFGGNGADKLYAEDPATCDPPTSSACVDVLYAGQDAKRDELSGGAGEDVYVVDEAAYRAGLANPQAANADVILDQQSLGEGVPLPADDRPHVLHQIAGDDPHLYFYR